MIVSLFITKFLTAPLVPVFAKLDTSAKAIEVEGNVGFLTTPVRDTGVGQMKATIDGSVITISVRTLKGQSLRKGEKVVIVEHLEKENIYIVEKIDHH